MLVAAKVNFAAKFFNTYMYKRLQLASVTAFLAVNFTLHNTGLFLFLFSFRS
jgi:hypothetical protein